MLMLSYGRTLTFFFLHLFRQVLDFLNDTLLVVELLLKLSVEAKRFLSRLLSFLLERLMLVPVGLVREV